MGIARTLARGSWKSSAITMAGFGLHAIPTGVPTMILNDEGNYVDVMRRITHPSFAAIEGEGIYTYECNPDETSNFHTAPARKVDTTVLKTISGSVLIRQIEQDEDVVITETWTGGGGKLSLPVDMFKTFWNFYVTVPDPDSYVTWEPRDISTTSFQVEIVDVSLGGVDMRYFERRPLLNSNVGAYVTETLTVKYKIVRPEALPTGAITLAGI